MAPIGISRRNPRQAEWRYFSRQHPNTTDSSGHVQRLGSDFGRISSGEELLQVRDIFSHACARRSGRESRGRLLQENGREAIASEGENSYPRVVEAVCCDCEGRVIQLKLPSL